VADTECEYGFERAPGGGPNATCGAIAGLEEGACPVRSSLHCLRGTNLPCKAPACPASRRGGRRQPLCAAA
jgi:hypothetical protein